MVKPVHGRAELEARYGRLLIEPDPRGGHRIVSPIGWEIANMTKIESALLPRGKLYVHKDMAGPLLLALASAKNVCPDYVVRRIGCWAVRYKRTAKKSVSLHAYGLAVDINPETNPMRSPLTTDMPVELILAFEEQGFTWGARFPTPDPMHFQFASGV
jgi:hypothetical protein